MTSPYRSDLDALRERLAALESEMTRLRAASAELDELRAREAELRAEAAEVERRIAEGSSKRALPMLDRLTVASPCSASWADMLGDERVRFCVSCEKNVYNLSEMTRADAEALLASRGEGELCVRYYQRADGTVMTTDCPVGVTKKRRKKLALAVAGAGAMAAATLTALTRGTTCPSVGVVQGAPEARVEPSAPARPFPAIMGSAIPRPIAPPEARPQPPKVASEPLVRMGKPSADTP